MDNTEITSGVLKNKADTMIDKPVIVSSDMMRGDGQSLARTPPGQTLTKKWPVLHYGTVPHIDTSKWELQVWGLCKQPYSLNWEEFNQLPKVDLKCDIHCVTHWSRLDNTFAGVAIRLLVERAEPLPEAKFVIQHAASAPGNDWTTNLPIEEFADEDCILATQHDGKIITAEHGYPVRAVVPRLYFWKGAKWITGIEFVAEDSPGFWEVNGYHMHGDPWKEERFIW